MTQQVPFLDLGRIHREFKAEFLGQVEEIFDSNRFIGGPQVRSFERAFAQATGTKHCIGVSNGTDALVVALAATGCGPGDQVITVANTFIATVEAIVTVGAECVLVDADPETSLMDPEKLAECLDAKQQDGSLEQVKAIVPVHLYGQCAPMGKIRELASAYGLKIIEDAAQAHGATQDGVAAGALGDVGCFSFYPGKNLGGCGDGGAIVTNDDAIADKVRCLSDHGQKIKYHHVYSGYNARLDTVQAAFLELKLAHLDQHNQSRRQTAQAYDEAFQSHDWLQPVKLALDNLHVHHLYVVHTQWRDQLQCFLSEHQIGTGMHYPVPVHLQPCYESLGYKRGDFPVSERLADRLLSLPMFPNMSDGEVGAVIDAVKTFGAKHVVR